MLFHGVVFKDTAIIEDYVTLNGWVVNELEKIRKESVVM